MNSNTIKIIALFLVAMSLVILAILSLPPMTSSDYAQLKIPRNFDDVRALSQILSNYSHNYYYQVILCIFIVYIFLQTFSVPGTIFINVLSGTLFGLYVAFPLTLLAATFGASSSFMLSSFLGRGLVQKTFPHKLELFKSEIQKHRGNLFYFLLFLRISPMLPNWFINISAPILNIPFHLFFLATLIGIMPQTFIAVNTGVTLADINEDPSEVFGIKTALTLMGIAFLSLLPVGINKLRERRAATTVIKKKEE